MDLIEQLNDGFGRLVTVLLSCLVGGQEVFADPGFMTSSLRQTFGDYGRLVEFDAVPKVDNRMKKSWIEVNESFERKESLRQSDDSAS